MVRRTYVGRSLVGECVDYMLNMAKQAALGAGNACMSGDCSSDTTAILLQKVVSHEKVKGTTSDGKHCNNKVCA